MNPAIYVPLFVTNDVARQTANGGGELGTGGTVALIVILTLIVVGVVAFAIWLVRQ